MSKEIEKFKGGLINNSSIIKKGLEISKKSEDPFAGMTEDEIFDEGKKLHNQNKYEEAIKYFSKCISLDPDRLIYHHWRGVIYNKMGSYEKAIEDLTIAISLNPNIWGNYHWRGRTYSKMRSYEKAIEDLTIAISLDPDKWQSYNWRGSSYNKMKRYEKSIEDLTKASSLNPDVPENYWWRGNSYEKLGFKDLAENDYKESERLKKIQKEEADLEKLKKKTNLKETFNLGNLSKNKEIE